MVDQSEALGSATYEAVQPHDHGCPVEQIHRVWTTDQGVDPWVLAEETLRFVQAWENRRCTCDRPPKRPKGVPLTSVYDPASGLWRPPATEAVNA